MTTKDQVTTTSTPDPKFFERADAHIQLSNTQLTGASRGEVNASMMFGMARYNAWVAAFGYESAAVMTEKRAETIDYFCDQFRIMLEDNYDDYMKNFDRYMTIEK
jgi:hypothetical protein